MADDVPTRTQGALCGAKKRSGEGTCTQPAGWGTQHVGQGRCRKHGGNNGPLKHGRYSTIKHTRYLELYEQFRNDPDPLNLIDELHMTRATLVHFIERYEEFSQALLAWHASFLGQRSVFEKVMDKFRHAARTKDIKAMGEAMAEMHALEAATPETPKPRQILDISDARNTLITIAKIAETIERIRGNVTKNDLIRILGEMGRTVEVNIRLLTDQLQAAAHDDGVRVQIGVLIEQGRARIEQAWREIPVG